MLEAAVELIGFLFTGRHFSHLFGRAMRILNRVVHAFAKFAYYYLLLSIIFSCFSSQKRWHNSLDDGGSYEPWTMCRYTFDSRVQSQRREQSIFLYITYLCSSIFFDWSLFSDWINSPLSCLSQGSRKSGQTSPWRSKNLFVSIEGKYSLG